MIFKLLAKAGSFARARLFVGITGVGGVLLVSIAALMTDLPGLVFAERGGNFLIDFALFTLWLAGCALITLPFEWLGGVGVPAVYGREHMGRIEWFWSWLFGTAILVLLGSVSGAAISLGGRLGGAFGASLVLIIASLALVFSQGTLATVIGRLRPVQTSQTNLREALDLVGGRCPPLIFVDSKNTAFTGGIVGFPTAEKCIFPVSWATELNSASLAALIARRASVINRGLRIYGVGLAILWVVFAFFVASNMPGAGVDTVAAICRTSLWFNLMTFIGLLLLPTLSRKGTLAADAHMLEAYPQFAQPWIDALHYVNTKLGDEPSRSRTIESVFYPIPNIENRIAVSGTLKPAVQPWHVARIAVFVALVGLSPFHRVVHCSAGQPEVWMLLPCDG